MGGTGIDHALITSGRVILVPGGQHMTCTYTFCVEPDMAGKSWQTADNDVIAMTASKNMVW